MLVVFSENSSPRLKFVLDFCFKEKGCSYELITSEKHWNVEKKSALNYSAKQLVCDYAIEPFGLLNETDIDPHLKLEKLNDKLGLRGDTDPLSVIFYLLSRYEEYQAHEKDSHGRFTASQSQQQALEVLYQPVCDKIVKKLWQKLGLDYSSVLAQYEMVPSFDIDIAWAFKNRPLWRKLGAFSKGQLTKRLGVLIGGKKDPYDTFGKIVQISSELNRIICFTPVSDYGPFDKNISHKNENYRSLVRGLNADGGLGLHPGYASFKKKEVLLEEKERLEAILGHPMKKARFHFLRFEIPTSYQIMIETGFTKDYSMGYADSAGFRAGTSFPFYFFDLEKNSSSEYLIFPFAYLDSALKDYMNLDPKRALELVEQLILEVKAVGGVFMCVWHNHSISNNGLWKDWSQVLDKTMQWGKK
jgi:Family of unknown function (DUF7033)